MAGEVVFSNLGGHAWQGRPAMRGGPVLADVMVPSSVPVMLVRPGYTPTMDTQAVIHQYLEDARQEIARNPRPVLRPSMPVKRPAGGGAAKTGGGTTTPPVAPAIPSPRRIDPMEQTMRGPDQILPIPRRIDPMEQTMRGPYYWRVPITGLGGIGGTIEAPLAANGASFTEDEALTQGGTRPSGPALKDVATITSIVPGAQIMRSIVANPTTAGNLALTALEGAIPGGGFLNRIMQAAYDALGIR